MNDETKKTPDQIATETMAKIQADKATVEEKDATAAKEAEAKAAAEGSPSEKKEEETPSEKTDEQLIDEAGEKAVEQAKVDAELAEKKDDDLSDEDKARKADLDAEKQIERKKKNDAKIEKRMTDLNVTIKRLDLEGKQHSEENKKLKAELDALKSGKPDAKSDVKSKLDKAENDRIKQYLDEDNSKPLAERREMTDEELSDWLLEDQLAAHRWMIKQDKRRDADRDADLSLEAKKFVASDLQVKQDESIKRVIQAHPELNVQARFAELKAQGKTDAEIQTVINTENPLLRVLFEIAEEDKNVGKYLKAETGPEQSLAEAKRRLKAEKDNESAEDKKKREEADAAKDKEQAAKDEEARIAQIREDAMEEERQRIDSIDEGLSSTRGSDKKKKTEETEADTYQARMAKKAGISPQKLEASKRRRESIQGAA